MDDYVEELSEEYIFDNRNDVYDYVYAIEGDNEFAEYVADRYAALYL